MLTKKFKFYERNLLLPTWKGLAPNVLSKLLLKRQAQEVEAAELQNLVTRPFCPYVTIMENPDDKMLFCRNPECDRKPNHVERVLAEWSERLKYTRVLGCSRSTCPKCRGTMC